MEGNTYPSFFGDLSNLGNVLNSFPIVSFPMNQRIEAYWSNSRKDQLSRWKHFLQDLVDVDIVDFCDYKFFIIVR